MITKLIASNSDLSLKSFELDMTNQMFNKIIISYDKIKRSGENNIYVRGITLESCKGETLTTIQNTFSDISTCVIDLQKKRISNLKVFSGSIIDAIEFELTDINNPSLINTIHCGGSGGGPTNVLLPGNDKENVYQLIKIMGYICCGGNYLQNLGITLRSFKINHGKKKYIS